MNSKVNSPATVGCAQPLPPPAPITSKSDAPIHQATTPGTGTQKRPPKNKLDQDMVRWTRVVGVFTGLLFVAAILQFCAMRGQLTEMKAARESSDAATGAQIGEMIKQYNALHDQITELKEANQINRSLIVAQAAIVYATSQVFAPSVRPGGGIIATQVAVNLMNGGNTFTRSATVHANFWNALTPMPSDYNFPDRPDVQVFDASFEPHAQHPVVAPWDISGEDLLEMQKGLRHLYVYGEVDYSDIFFPITAAHVFKFCSELKHVVGDLATADRMTLAGMWLACPRHNCSDDGCNIH